MFNSHGTSWPKSSQMMIMAEMSTKAQKKLNGPPLKFKDESFGAIKFFKKSFFNGNFTGKEPKIDQK